MQQQNQNQNQAQRQQPQQGARNADQERVAVAVEFVQQYYSKFATKTELHNREHSKHRKKKLCKDDFDVFTCIGRGAFGEVRLCKYKNDPRGTVYVMKMVKKEVMIQKNHVTHVRTERNLMVDAGKDNDWLVKLFWTFQDQTYLYFIMEFAQGGDMMWWLIQKDTFEEPVAKFYIAELVLAVYSLHQLDYAHRDLKPDNILLDSTGHLKLTDFGFAKRTAEASARLAQQALQATLNKDKLNNNSQQNQQQQQREEANNEQLRLQQLQQMAQQGVQVPQGMDPHTAFRLQRQAPGGRSLFFSTVGSPGYIAPEVLLQKGHDGSVDWWAVGVILYEMLYGYPPFYGDAGAHTGYKIARWKDYLDFPRADNNGSSTRVSADAIDLIKRLVCDARDRLSIEQILQHPFFRGVDWSNIRSQPAPFKVDVSGPLDTRYFDAVPDQPNQASSQPGSGHHHPHQQFQTLFYGFTSKDRDAPGVTMSTQYNYTVQQPQQQQQQQGNNNNNSNNNNNGGAGAMARSVNQQQQVGNNNNNNNSNSGSPMNQQQQQSQQQNNNNNAAVATAINKNNNNDVNNSDTSGSNNSSQQQVSQQSSTNSQNANNNNNNNNQQQLEQGNGNAPTVWT